MDVSSKSPNFHTYICRNNYVSFIPTQGTCYVLLPANNNRPVMDHRLMTGTLYYILTYIPTHLLSHHYVVGYFCF